MNDRLNLTADVAPAPAFEAFSWVTPEAAAANDQELLQAVCAARDVAHGAALVLAMLEREEIDACCADEKGLPLPKLFSEVERGNLQRFAIASLQLLGERADAIIDRVNARAGKQAET